MIVIPENFTYLRHRQVCKIYILIGFTGNCHFKVLKQEVHCNVGFFHSILKNQIARTTEIKAVFIENPGSTIMLADDFGNGFID